MSFRPFYALSFSHIAVIFIKQRKATAFSFVICGITLFTTGLAPLASSNHRLHVPGTVATAASLFNSNSDKAKDYGDISDEDSHAIALTPMQIAGKDGGDKASDYGDVDNDDNHTRLQAQTRVADSNNGGDKAKDYGDISDDGSHSFVRQDLIVA